MLDEIMAWYLFSIFLNFIEYSKWNKLIFNVVYIIDLEQYFIRQNSCDITF